MQTTFVSPCNALLENENFFFDGDVVNAKVE